MITQASDTTSPGTETFDCPLCVDLDGTLVRTDMVVESFVALLRQRPFHLLFFPYWLLMGRGRLKAEVAARVRLDPVPLPYHQEFMEFILSEKRRGRRLVLATAADQKIADSIARHLGIFDVVLGSNNDRNLKGSEKARVLADEFGVRGFSYAGNESCDLAVWKVARSAITVNVSKSVLRRMPRQVPIEQRFTRDQNRLKLLLRALRPHQWVKNILVLVPIVTAGGLGDFAAWRKLILLLAAFCSTASGLYLFNDTLDVSADRNHPRKKNRPFAGGQLPLAMGLGLTPLLVVAGLGLGMAAGGTRFLLAYAAVSLLYSLKLKELPLVDIFSLAALYSLRLFSGGEVSNYPVSFWLLAFSSFFFFSLAIIKRVAELNGTGNSGRGYLSQDREILQTIGVGASLVSSTLLALYVQSDVVARQHANPRILWVIVPLMLFWQCHLWLATGRGSMHDDPIVYAARDWVSWLTGVALLAALVASFVRF
jgi:4-hydroxybenzoate polyprenyltransferase/phosphoserine phosphatase